MFLGHDLLKELPFLVASQDNLLFLKNALEQLFNSSSHFVRLGDVDARIQVGYQPLLDSILQVGVRIPAIIGATLADAFA